MLSLPAEPLASVLAVINAQPDDDEPRLALATWLERQGDPRAALIRIQVERARTDEQLARHDDLERASRQWLHEHQTAWLGPPAEGVTITWDRGLPVATVTENVVLAGWPEALKRNLEQGWLVGLELNLTGTSGQSLLAAWEGHEEIAARLRQLTGARSGYTVGNDVVRSLAPLAWLRALDLGAVVADETVVEHLLGMKELRALILPGPSPFGGLGFGRLAAAGVLDPLRKLTIRGCRLTDVDLDNLRRARELQTLSLEFFYPTSRLEADGITVVPAGQKPKSRYRGALLKRELQALGACRKLRSLTISFVQFPRGNWSVPPLPELTRLQLHSCHLLDSGLKPLGQLQSLEELALGYLPVTGAGFAHLTQLPRLRRLGLIYCQKLQAEFLEILTGIPALEALGMSSNRFEPAALAHLARLTGLRSLDLIDASFTGSDRSAPARIDELSSLKKLEYLRLPHKTNAGTLSVLSAFPEVRRLALYGATLDAQALRQIEQLPKLRHLELRMAVLTDDAWERLASLVNLESLDLCATGIGDTNLQHLRSLTSLISLDLSSCGISDAGLPYLAGLPALETLNLEENFVSPTAVRRHFPEVQVACRFED